MKEKNFKDIEKELNNMKFEEVDVMYHQKVIRLTLLNTKKTAIWGIILIFLPLLFLIAALLNQYLHISFLFKIFEFFYRSDARLHFWNVFSPIIFFTGLIAAFILNTLAIFHFSVKNDKKELLINVSIKKKTVNIIIIFVCLFLLIVFIAYGLFENFLYKLF